MCELRKNWEKFMQEGEKYIEEGRECLEPDDGDAGSTRETKINLNGAVNLNGVKVSPFLSFSGENIGDAVFLDTWFDGLSREEFNACWRTQEQKIKALVRYPGGYHEWLMVSTLPELKAMGVPMQLIREMIIPTSECSFYVDGEKCLHGKRGSGIMHRDLFRAIIMTYYGELAMDGKDYVNDGEVDYEEKLRANLTAFFIVYYPEGTCFPEEVTEFLGIEGYAGE